MEDIEYDNIYGIYVNIEDIKYEEIDKNNPSEDFISRLRKYGKKQKLDETEKPDFETRLKNFIDSTQIYRASSMGIDATIIVLLLILPLCYVLPTYHLFTSGEAIGILIGIAYSVLFFGAFGLYFGLNFKKNKPIKQKIEALSAGEYEIFYFDEIKKMYCGYYAGKCFIEKFFIDCGKFIIIVKKREYDMITDKAFFTVIHINGKIKLEITGELKLEIIDYL
ncbi:MAG: hypothetical protein FWF82_05110 [Oscillospiraceae bacterium]|jgi:hypothetical protein|nr:hypothetical protein [Oscillospiraceae bacterium]